MGAVSAYCCSWIPSHDLCVPAGIEPGSAGNESVTFTTGCTVLLMKWKLVKWYIEWVILNIIRNVTLDCSLFQQLRCIEIIYDKGNNVFRWLSLCVVITSCTALFEIFIKWMAVIKVLLLLLLLLLLKACDQLYWNCKWCICELAVVSEHKQYAVIAWLFFISDELDSKRMSLTTKSRYSLAENSLKICEDLVAELMRQDDAWPFLKPVTKKEVNSCQKLTIICSMR